MDISLTKVWSAWYAFYRGKKITKELDIFAFRLEKNLNSLYKDLTTSRYRHGPYRSFKITDTKKRRISVASIRDRVVQRLIYDYLVMIFDRTFIYDAWSCRKGKGLLGAILRTQQLLSTYRYAFVWRGDITKFFDSIDHKVLKASIRRKVSDVRWLQLIDEVIDSYFFKHKGKGVPIGNLTSQIFTNIYLHELDRFVLNKVKPFGYIRYGDDFLLISQKKSDVEYEKERLTVFINRLLKLKVNYKNSVIVKASRGVRFLGCEIYPKGRKLPKRLVRRISLRLNLSNCASYRALLLAHSEKKWIEWVDWRILNLL